jgi:hypothetical protein
MEKMESYNALVLLKMKEVIVQLTEKEETERASQTHS